MAHRDEVPGRNSSSPHLYNHEIEKTVDGGYLVRFWSDQGWFHDCWITATVTPDCVVTFTHCGDSGMVQLAQLVREDLIRWRRRQQAAARA